MSSIALSGNAAGAGVFTIASPNSASSFTATLPQQTGTLVAGADANSVTLPGSSSGTVTLTAPAVAGTTTITLAAQSGTLYPAGPAFSAYFNGSTQSISASTWTKVTMNAEDFDTNTNYDPTTNYRFTPTIAGYYQITSSVFFSIGASATGASLAIYKNGSIYKGAATYSLANGGMEGSISLPILFNGSTDYVEIYVWVSAAGTVITGSTNTGYGGAGGANALFNGYLIRGT